MESFDQLKERIRLMQPDIRLEVILADLLADGMRLEDIELISSSLFRRSYHREIEEVTTTAATPYAREKLQFVVNRQGLYDQLPEDLFHQPAETKGTPDKSKTLQELRDNEKTEQQSRRFFLPFEHEFYRQRVRLEFEERNFLFETSGNVPAEIFDLLWELPEFLDEQQKSRIGLLLPVLHAISGNIVLMEAAMESVTGESVNIRQTAPRLTEMTEHLLLGAVALGKSSMLSGMVSSYVPGYEVRIRLPDNRSLPDWLYGGQKRILFEYLCTLLMPLDADVSVEPDVSLTGSRFRLDETEAGCARLNFTTNL